MADLSSKNSSNVSGAYYVDENCIDCDACHAVAPDNFDRNDKEGYCFVCKQPENNQEKALCEEAKDGCPVDAIGNDGV